MNDAPGTTSTPLTSGPDNRRRNMTIAIVVGLALLCCCCVAVPSLYTAWVCGDYWLGGPVGSCFLVP